MRRARPALLRDERGMTTAEYAIGTVAAASFAALLIKLLTSDEVRQLLLDIVTSALRLAG
jgi:Flp pilus assembly pilin Flp